MQTYLEVVGPDYERKNKLPMAETNSAFSTVNLPDDELPEIKSDVDYRKYLDENADKVGEFRTT